MDLSSLNGFVFGLVSNGIASFKLIRQLKVCIGDFPSPSSVHISRCLFLQTFATSFELSW